MSDCFGGGVDEDWPAGTEYTAEMEDEGDEVCAEAGFDYDCYFVCDGAIEDVVCVIDV